MMFLTRGPLQGPLMPSLLPMAKTFLTSLSIRLVCLFVKSEVLENKVFSRYHDLRQPPRKDIEGVRLRFPDNC